MNKLFSDEAFGEYINWVQEDKKAWKRINELIKDIERNGVDQGIGQPEPLKHGFSGYWSRRIIREHRLIYNIDEDTNTLCIISCKDHY